jgi:hypothetical protein
MRPSNYARGGPEVKRSPRRAEQGARRERRLDHRHVEAPGRPRSVRMADMPYNAAMPRAGVFDVSFLVLSSLAVVVGVVAYVRDPSLPGVGARNGLALLWFILPRLVPALILAGMLQVVIPQEGWPSARWWPT